MSRGWDVEGEEWVGIVVGTVFKAGRQLFLRDGERMRDRAGWELEGEQSVMKEWR